MRKFFSKLHWQVAAALFAAVALAATFRIFGAAETPFGAGTVNLLSSVGSVFMRMLSMIVVPLVVTSVVCGSMHLGASGKFLRIGAKTLLFYAVTGLLATCLAVFLINAAAPGDIPQETAKNILGGLPPEKIAQESHQGHSVSEVVLRMFPPNIVAAASDNTQLLGLIIFAVVLGVFINSLPEKHAEFQRKLWQSFNACFEKITYFIMRFLPIGVFALTAPVCVRAGLDVIGPVLSFFVVVVAALLLHALITMSAILYSAGIPPAKHLKAMMPAIITAFSTSSSVATVPVTLECVEGSARVSKDISGFTIPLGATVNMNGSALYECVAVIFISQIMASAGGAPLDIGTQFMVIILALLTSIGVAGIPSASLVAIVLIMGVAGIPAEAVGIIWMTDRLLDMMRTSVNIYGDSCAAVWIAKTEGENVYPESSEISK